MIEKPRPKVLVVDIGGNNVKLLAYGQKEPRRFPSGPALTPTKLVQSIKQITTDWEFEVLSIGYPGAVIHGKILRDPKNLGKGWVGFNFEKAFGHPVQLINDAAMQAMGSYEGGRMLFLGLGTGLGSAMIMDGVLEPMELAHLPYRKKKTFEDYVGARGAERMGKKKWRLHVALVVEMLRAALEPDYVVLGGGNVKWIDKLPPGTRRGSNEHAFDGGIRMWQMNKDRQPEPTTEIVLH